MQTAILLTITVIGWGLFHNFVKLASNHLPVPAMQIVSALCWLCTIPLYLVLLNKTPHKWNFTGIGWCIAAFLSTNIGTFAYMYVLSKNNVSGVVGIASSYPMIVMLVALIFMGESFSWQKFVGAILVLAGVFISTK